MTTVQSPTTAAAGPSAAPDPTTANPINRTSQRIGRTLLTAVLIVLSVLWLVPSYLIVVNAFTATDSYTGTANWWFTSPDLFGNIAMAFETASVGQGMINSLIYAVVSAAAAVLISAAASFAVVIMPVRRQALWFWVIYLGTILPLQMFLAPLFKAYASISLYDTQFGMILIYTAITIPFAFFVIRNYLTTVPNEMREAASIDGAGWIRTFFLIHLPLSKSALLAAFIFQFTWVWNDLIFGIALSTSPNIRPVMATLADLNGNYSTVGPPVALAGALVASLPTVILFFVFQRFFVTSLKLTN